MHPEKKLLKLIIYEINSNLFNYRVLSFNLPSKKISLIATTTTTNNITKKNFMSVHSSKRGDRKEEKN